MFRKLIFALALAMIASAADAAVHRKVWLENAGDDYVDLCVRVWGDTAPEKPDSLVAFTRNTWLVATPQSDIFGWMFIPGFSGTLVRANADSMGISIRYPIGYYHTMALPVQVKLRYNTGVYAVIAAEDDIVITDPVPALVSVDSLSFGLSALTATGCTRISIDAVTDIPCRIRVTVYNQHIPFALYTYKSATTETEHYLLINTTLPAIGDSIRIVVKAEQVVGTLPADGGVALGPNRAVVRGLIPNLAFVNAVNGCPTIETLAYTYSTFPTFMARTLEWQEVGGAWSTPMVDYNGSAGSGTKTHNMYNDVDCASASGKTYEFRVKFLLQDWTESAYYALPNVVYP